MMSIIEQQEEAGFMPENSIAVNEIESNGFLYPMGKPSEESIKQLRAIKQQRFKDKIESADIQPEGILKADIEHLQRSRGENRAEIEKRMTEKIITFFKNSEMAGFSRSRLNGLIETGTDNKMTLSRITNKILKNMELMQLVKKEVIKKRAISLENKPLSSQDYGSFEVLMRVNKNKPKALKGCYSNGSLSVVRRVQDYTQEIYTLI